MAVYFKLFQNQAKNIADLFSIKWEFDKMEDLSVFLGHKKLKWDPISSGTDCTGEIKIEPHPIPLKKRVKSTIVGLSNWWWRGSRRG